MAERVGNGTSELLAVETAAARSDRAQRRQTILLARRLLIHLGSLERQLGVHDPLNSAVTQQRDELAAALRELGGRSGVVTVVFVTGHTFVNGVWVRTTGRAWETARDLTERLRRGGARGLRFLPEASGAALVSFGQFLRRLATMSEVEGLELLNPGIPGIELLQLPPEAADEEGTRVRFRQRAAELLEEGMLTLDPARVGNMDVYLRRRQRSLALRLVQMAEETPEDLLILTAVRDATITSVAHNLMVAILSISVGRLMDLRRRDLVRLGVCALSHNVGETLLPPELFKLEREFTPQEMEVTRTHPLLGMAHLLEQFGFDVPIVERALASAEHHIHMDGQGYPRIGHHKPHVFSRIIAVADVFNALSSPRPQRDGYPSDQAMKLVNRRAITQLDPLIVRVFLRLVGRYPPGSLVELDTGEFGIVVGPGAGLKPLVRPRVLLLTDAAGFELDMPVLADLGERHPRRRAWLRTIVRTRDPARLAVPVSRYLMADRLEPAPGRMDIDDPAALVRKEGETDLQARRRFDIAGSGEAPTDLSVFGLGVGSSPTVVNEPNSWET